MIQKLKIIDYKTNNVQVRLLNNLTWKIIGEYKHEPSITDKKIVCYENIVVNPVDSWCSKKLNILE
jgi:hypothetical protein